MRFIFLFFFLLLTFTISGCSTRGYKVYTKKQLITPSENNSTINPNNNNNINYKTKILFSEYEKWKDTPYIFGGQSLNGIDCSSFIQQVYYDGFGLRVPRTTIKQLKIGYEVQKEDLEVGDMIFFKTAYNILHVGIIIEDGAFVHTSTSKGVRISSIYNPYWVDVYYQSRRVLP